MKYALVLLVLGCLVTAVAQQWQVELVDSSCKPTDVFVKRDSARTYIAYVTRDGSIRIAFKDTVWHYETLDTGLVRADYGFHFALGPARRMAVSGLDDSLRLVVLEKSATSWRTVWTHGAIQDYSFIARAVYGSDTSPSILYCANNWYWADVIVETRMDSVWQVDTAMHFDPPSNYSCELVLVDADRRPDAGPCCLARWAYSFPLDKVPPSIYIEKVYHAGGGWHVGGWGGFQASVGGYDICAGGSDSAYSAVYHDGCTSFDADPVWPGRARDAAVQVDSAGRRLMAFVTSDSVLQLAFKTGFWHFCEVPGISTATRCDLALDEYGQPMIAFEDSAGLSLVRGTDVVGVKAAPSAEVQAASGGPTILSESSVQSLVSKVVFDAQGRRVAQPKPGVYFVRDEGSGAGVVGRTRKVVITR